MTTKNIHGSEVEYDETSETTKSYLDHLEYRLSREEFKAFIEDAHRDPLRKIHLDDNHGNKFTLEYKSEDRCLIRKRQL